MKIQIWELRLYYNLFDVLFGKYQTIEEIYIPKLNHSFNFYEDDVNVIKTNNERYKSQNIFYHKVKPVLIKEYELNKKDLQMYKNFIKYNTEKIVIK